MALYTHHPEAADARYNCNLPFWNAPAESNDGLFTGDLSLDCTITEESAPTFNALNLRKRIVDKVKSESLVNQEPDSNLLLSAVPLTWDVSHRFVEEGNTIQIREMITLSIENRNQLKYNTRSKEITASGMASYLRSIEFTMTVTQVEKHIKVSFRNRVQVKRPWYALDLIFAPIAKNTCFKKMNQVKEKFMPWIIRAIQNTAMNQASPN
jgi:hypothetical protein